MASRAAQRADGGHGDARQPVDRPRAALTHPEPVAGALTARRLVRPERTAHAEWVGEAPALGDLIASKAVEDHFRELDGPAGRLKIEILPTVDEPIPDELRNDVVLLDLVNELERLLGKSGGVKARDLGEVIG